MFPDLVELTGNMGEIYEKVRKGKNIFEPVPSHFKNKYMRDVVQAEIDHKQISKNLKLVSFELISREVDDPSSLEMNNRREQILETINTTKTTRRSYARF
jgi:hypothetical protein